MVYGFHTYMHKPKWEIYNLIVRVLRSRGHSSLKYYQIILDIDAMGPLELARLSRDLDSGELFTYNFINAYVK